MAFLPKQADQIHLCLMRLNTRAVGVCVCCCDNRQMGTWEYCRKISGDFLIFVFPRKNGNGMRGRRRLAAKCRENGNGNETYNVTHGFSLRSFTYLFSVRFVVCRNTLAHTHLLSLPATTHLYIIWTRKKEFSFSFSSFLFFSFLILSL